MNRIQPYPVAVALSFIFLLLYLVCVLIHYLLPDTGWHMYQMWEMVLIGFTWITTLSFLLGILEVFLGGFFVAYTLIPFYNFFDVGFSVKEGETTMKPLRFKSVALALMSFGVLTYILCILYDLLFPHQAMYRLWEMLLPGFTWISWGSFFIGLIGVIVYSLYIAGVFVPVYNYFRSSDLPELK